MKKVFLPLLAMAFIACMSSCAKCVQCTKGDSFQKFCDKDNDSEEVDDAIDFWEASGWDCKKGTQMY